MYTHTGLAVETPVGRLSEFSTLWAGVTSSWGSAKTLSVKYHFPLCVSVASAGACSGWERGRGDCIFMVFR